MKVLIDIEQVDNGFIARRGGRAYCLPEETRVAKTPDEAISECRKMFNTQANLWKKNL